MSFPGTEWTSRKRSDGKYDLYGRWVGLTPVDEPADES